MDDNYRPVHQTLDGLMNELKIKGWIKTPQVEQAMRIIDRKDFAPTNPYENNPQCINYNVVISAPLLHAYCLEAMRDHLKPGCRALDIGYGSGYLTAAMSVMIGDNGCVVGIEHVKDLAKWGEQNIRKNHADLLDKQKVVLTVGDGREGYKKMAPYNCIHVGANSLEPPKALLEQLAPGGRLVIPLGPYEDQYIYTIDKDYRGNFSYCKGLCVTYVPLTSVENQLGGCC